MGEQVIGNDLFFCSVRMNCLHGKPAVYSTTNNGTFWFCGENPTCNFICADNECYMFEKAITAWSVRSTRDAVIMIGWPRCVS